MIRTLRTRLAVLLVMLALVLAACGGDEPASTTESEPMTEDSSEAMESETMDSESEMTDSPSRR